MKIVAGLQVFEEEDFIEATLLSLYEWCDVIVVCEGAWASTAKVIGGKTSRDKTVEIIKGIKDPDNKIKLFHYSGKNQVDQREFCLQKALEYKPDWYLLSDGDEVFHEKDVPAIINLLSSTPHEGLCYKWRLYWNDLYHYEDGYSGGRFFKINNYRCNVAAMCRLKHSDGRDYRLSKTDAMTVFHPSYVKSVMRQQTKIDHRTVDDGVHFPHMIIEDLIWRGVNRKEPTLLGWFNNLNIGTKEELPIVLQDHKLINKMCSYDYVKEIV